MKERLTKKIGPLPAWAWALIGGVALYWFRNRKGKGTLGTGTTSPTVSDSTAAPPQGQILQPGESVYNPGSGTLTTAPGGGGSNGSGGGGGSSDPSGAIASAMQSIADAMSRMNVPSNGADGQPGPPGSPGTSTVHKRRAKTKAAHKPGTDTKVPRHKDKEKPRSSTTIRHPLRDKSGRPGFTGKPLPGKRHPVTGHTAPHPHRNKPTNPAIHTTAPVHHTEATHPKAKAPTVHVAPPRPSSPPTRKTRIPVTRKPPRQVRPH